MTHSIVIAGPTASGKSTLAIELACALNGEILCGDSRQLYCGMQVGAAGPTDDDRLAIPHHGYGVEDPLVSYDAGRFVDACDRRVEDVNARGKTAFIVGGAGMYLRAWRFGLTDVPGRDPAVRQDLEAALSALGVEALYARLLATDPASAARIEPKDAVRIVRALEVLAVTGRLASAQRLSHTLDSAPRVHAIWVLLEADMGWLMPRIEARARAMFAGGLVEEALALRERTGRGHPLLRTMGYEEALAYADGTLSLEEAIRRAAHRQRAYARRQRTWFRKEPWWTRFSAEDAGLVASILRQLHNQGA